MPPAPVLRRVRSNALSLKGVEAEGVFRLPGTAGDVSHCTVAPSPA